MATYITLGKYTQQGISTMKASPARVDAVRETARSLGAELKAFYLVMGQFDFVAVLEAPDDATLAKLILMIAGQGNATFQTSRAFTETEYRGIVAALP